MAGFLEMTAKLLLDSLGFDKNIKKSKKEVDGFSKAGAAMGKELVGQFKKIAGAALAIKGAEDVFRALINSSQTLGDAFAANMSAMQTVANNFIYSLANADFTPFNQGLSEMIAKAKEAYNAMDQLGNTQMAVDYLSATSGADFRTYMAKARDKSLSVEERKEWLAKAKAEAKKLEEGQATLARDAREAVATQLAATAGIDRSFITEEMINNALLLDTRGSNIQEREALKKKYDAIQSQIKEIEKTAGVDENDKSWFRRFLEGLGPKSNFTRLSEEARQKIAAVGRQVRSLMEANADTLTAYGVLFRESDKGLDKLYATARSSVAAQRQLAEYTTSVNEVKAQINAEEAKPKVSEETLTAARNYQAITTMTELPGASAMIPPAMVQQLNAQAVIDNPFLAKVDEQVKGLETMSRTVDMLSNSFSQLGSAIGGSAGEMLTFVGNVLNAVQAIIPFIGYLQAEQMAHRGVASAAATEAAAKSMSAYAGIPFAGIGLGVSAVSAIIAAISSIPKFAEGGVVTSATLGVFGEAGPEAVMPLDRLEDFLSPREMRVTGQIKASGKDLVVVIDNYNRVRHG